MRNGHVGGDATRDGLSHGDGAAPDGLPRRAGDPRAGRTRSPGPPPQQPAAHRHPANDQPPRGPGVPPPPRAVPRARTGGGDATAPTGIPPVDTESSAHGSDRSSGQPHQPRSDPAAETADAADRTSPGEATAAEAPGRHRRRAGRASSAGTAATAGPVPPHARPRSGRRSSFWKELPLLIVVALLLTFAIQTFLAKVYVIPSGSMESTLHGCVGCHNDRVLVDKISYGFGEPAPGDVVVFRGPESWSSEVIVQQPTNALVRGLQLLGSAVGLAPPDEKDFVKRVIAVGGQTVQCCDSGNRVLVDGRPLTEPYLYFLPEAGPPRQNAFGPVVVPDGQLWMMGDSRNNSADSRVTDHGPVPVDNVIGKARWIVLPFNRFGPVTAVDPQPTAVGQPAPGSDVPGSDLGAPLALGLLGTLPLAAVRRRLTDPRTDLDAFLPDPACDPSKRRR